MKLKITLLLLLIITSLSGYSQIQPFGHLTIFSEDGDAFQLILNGKLINDIPQTHMRVEELNQPYYNAKIIFEDKTIAQITKNNLMIAGADGNFADVTYKIKRDRNNIKKTKISFFSHIAVDQGYTPPSNVHVIHYGHLHEAAVKQTTDIIQTTTTQTGGTTIGVGVNIEGIGVGITVNDNIAGGTVTQTTTTQNGAFYHEPEYKKCKEKASMSSKNFSTAMTTIKSHSFDETRLKTAKQVVSTNCLNVTQIIQIASTFSFEESKLDFAKFAYDYCVEPNNYFKMNGMFSFSGSVDELTDYIEKRN